MKRVISRKWLSNSIVVMSLCVALSACSALDTARAQINGATKAKLNLAGINTVADRIVSDLLEYVEPEATLLVLDQRVNKKTLNHTLPKIEQAGFSVQTASFPVEYQIIETVNKGEKREVNFFYQLDSLDNMEFGSSMLLRVYIGDKQINHVFVADQRGYLSHYSSSTKS